MKTNAYKEALTNFSNEFNLSIQETTDLYYLFIEELNQETNNLEKAIPEQNNYRIQRIIHNIKGISINYKMVNIYDIASKIDNTLKSENPIGLDNLLTDLINCIRADLQGIIDYFNSINS